MKVVLEISKESGKTTIGGIEQPIISQRKIEHEIRLKDGEMNLLGGILEEQELKTIGGTPVLGQIPVLGRLFSREKKEKLNNEIVFLLIPHVVRGQELSELNQRSFDVGTATGIGLRMNPKPVQKSENTPGEPSAPVAAQPPQPIPGHVTPMQPQATVPQASIQSQASVQPQSLGGQSQPVYPQQALPASGQTSPPAAIQPNAGPATKPASAATPNGPVTLQLSPGSLTPSQGSTFAVNIVLSGGQDVFSVPVQISYDPQLLQFLTVSNGDFLSKDNSTVALVNRDDPATGTLIMNAQRPPGAAGVSGDGTVFRLTFMARNRGSG